MRPGDCPVPALGRLLGIDLGNRRIGVATCDSGRRMATALTVIHRVGNRSREHGELSRLVDEYEGVGVIVGLPLSLSAQIGPAAAAVIEEAKELQEYLGVPVTTHDERFTTVSATSSLVAAGRRGRKQRAVVDQVAAAVILQSWLDGQASAR
jgi:putative Holliday junction resolvase